MQICFDHRKFFKKPEKGIKKRKRPIDLLRSEAEIICSSPLSINNSGLTQDIKLIDLTSNVSPVKSHPNYYHRYSLPSEISPLKSAIKKKYVYFFIILHICLV